MTEDEKQFFKIQQNFFGANATQVQVHEAIRRMPKDVQAIAAEIQWFSVGDRLWGAADHIGGRDVVILDDTVPEDEFPALIGHEVAHVVLHRESGVTAAHVAGREAEAAALALSWGFKGFSTDVGASVEGGLYGIWKLKRSDFTGAFVGLGQFAEWAAGWGLHSAQLWGALEDSFSPEQRELWRKYQQSGSERRVCDAWARGEGNRQPKPPPKHDVLTR